MPNFSVDVASTPHIKSCWMGQKNVSPKLKPPKVGMVWLLRETTPKIKPWLNNRMIIKLVWSPIGRKFGNNCICFMRQLVIVPPNTWSWHFECAVCKEKQRAIPRHLASLEPHPPKWSTVAADFGDWTHPHSGHKFQFVLFIDEGSRFRVGRMVLEGSKPHVNSSLFLSTFRDAWIQYFGHPQTCGSRWHLS